MPDWLFFVLVVLAIFCATFAAVYLLLPILGRMLLAFLIDKGVEIAVEHGPPTLRKAVSAVWRKIYPRLPRWAQRVLPTPTASTPRRNGPASQGGNPVATNPNPANPAGAGQPAPQAPEPREWPAWVAPMFWALLVLVTQLVANLTPLYYTGLSEQMPTIWVAMQIAISILVGIIVWLVGRLRSLQLDLLFIYELYPQLRRPEDWTPPAAQPQAPANQQPNP